MTAICTSLLQLSILYLGNPWLRRRKNHAVVPRLVVFPAQQNLHVNCDRRPYAVARKQCIPRKPTCNRYFRLCLVTRFSLRALFFVMLVTQPAFCMFSLIDFVDYYAVMCKVKNVRWQSRNILERLQ